MSSKLRKVMETPGKNRAWSSMASINFVFSLGKYINCNDVVCMVVVVHKTSNKTLQ